MINLNISCYSFYKLKTNKKERLEGKIEAYRETAKLMLEDGVRPDVVAKYVKAIPKDEIQKIFDEILKK